MNKDRIIFQPAHCSSGCRVARVSPESWRDKAGPPCTDALPCHHRAPHTPTVTLGNADTPVHLTGPALGCGGSPARPGDTHLLHTDSGAGQK